MSNTLPELVNTIRLFIAERGGLYFQDHDLKSLEVSISQRMASLKIDSIHSYYLYLTTSLKKEDELRELFNLLTVNHTYFFRNEAQFEVLRDRLIPEILQKKGSLRIWSAGCSTGEEPYTIAMIVKDLVPNLEAHNVEIIATDASTESLQKAMAGVYTTSSMRLVPADVRDRYFKQITKGNETRFHVSDEIKKMVKFSYFNLLDEEYPSGFDIIFCRNVVIYFDFATVVKVMENFYVSLANLGYLFIGYSETLQFISEKFQMRTSADAVYYQRADGTKKEGTGDAREHIDIDAALDRISRAVVDSEKKDVHYKFEVPKKEIEDLIVSAVKEMQMKNYMKALGFVERAILLNDKILEPYFIAAEIYANQGRLNEARSRLGDAIRINSMFAPAYCLCGATYLQEDDLAAAKVNFKKSIYIDPDFSLAHFYLAMLYKKQSNLLDSIREFRNTLKALGERPPSDILPYSGGFNVATLKSVCKDNLERLKEAL